jgi:SNF2 family DNA or RNA helicase
MKKFMEDRYKFYQANMRQYVRIYEDGISFYERTLKTHADREEFKIYRTYIRKIVDNYDPIEDAKIAKFVKEIETKKVIPSLQQPLKNKFKDALSVYKYSKLRVMGEFLGKLSHIRAECSVEIAKYGNLDKLVLDADKKSIVFSSFIPALVACDKYFTDRGFKTLAVHGDQTRNIATIVDRFKKDPDVNPLFGTLQSLAASQTLTVANVVIFLDSPFREYQKSQAYHRVFRIGQDCQTYIYMCAMESGVEPNISSRSADILAWSQQQVESIFGSATREEAMGIVKQLRLNPPSGMDQLLGMIKNVFGM